MTPTPNRLAYIYVLIDPRDLAIRYVGMTYDLSNRMRTHLKKSQVKDQNYKARWIRVLLAQGLRPLMKAILIVEPEQAGAIEAKVIALFRARGERLTNMALGGVGWTVGNTHTDETKRRMSETHKGHPVSQKTLDALRLSRIGKKNSEATRKLIREKHLGTRASDDTKHKMSLKRSGVKRPEISDKIKACVQARARDPKTGLLLSKMGTVTLKTYTCVYCAETFTVPQKIDLRLCAVIH